MKSQERIALKKETFNEVKKELVWLAGIFVVLVIVFKIAFYKENLTNILMLLLSVFWLGVMPGFVFMLYYLGRLSFAERLIIGTALGFAVLGIVSYYLGFMGLHLKIHHIVVPILEIVSGVVLFYYQNKK